MFSWDDLKYFLAMAEQGSLSAAARHLEVSQPTLSRRLTALESDVGAELFTRTRFGLEMTALGEEFVDHIRRMQDDVHAVERLVTGHDSSLKGSVVISCTETLGAQWLVKHMLPFREQYPGITVEIKISNTSSNLMRREADIALRLYRPEQDDLIAKKMVTMNYGYYASRRYIEKHGTPQSLECLEHHSFIMPYDDILQHIAQRPSYRSRVPFREPAFRSNSLTTLEAAVREGIGIGAYSCLHAHNDDNLVRLFQNHVVVSTDIWLVAHAELKRSARIRAMYDYLGQLLTKHKSTFTGMRD